VRSSAIPVDSGYAKIRIRRGCVLRHFGRSAAASSRRSISIATERDIVLMTLDQPAARRASAELAFGVCARQKKKSARVAAEKTRRRPLGPEHLHRYGSCARPSRSVSPRCTCAIDARGRPRGTEARKRPARYRTLQRQAQWRPRLFALRKNGGRPVPAGFPDRAP